MEGIGLFAQIFVLLFENLLLTAKLMKLACPDRFHL